MQSAVWFKLVYVYKDNQHGSKWTKWFHYYKKGSLYWCGKGNHAPHQMWDLYKNPVSHIICSSQGLTVSPQLFSPSKDKAIIETLSLCVSHVHTVHKVERNGSILWYAVLKGQLNTEVKNAILTLSPVDVQKSQASFVTHVPSLWPFKLILSFYRYAIHYGRKRANQKSRNHNHMFISTSEPLSTLWYPFSPLYATSTNTTNKTAHETAATQKRIYRGPEDLKLTSVASSGCVTSYMCSCTHLIRFCT